MIPTIAQLMTTTLHTIGATQTIDEAAKAMARHRTGSLLVRRGGEYVGIITEVDIIRKVIAKARKPAETMVGEVMTTPLVTIEADQTILDANALMESKQIRHLVVRQYGDIAGIVSVRDLLHPIFLEHDKASVKKASGF